MRTIREWLHRLWGTLRRVRRDADLEEELRFHLQLAVEDAQRGGLDSAERIRAARLKSGGASQALDALRDQRGLPWLDGFSRDLRHGLRMLRRSPGFTAVALVTLALGIGANTAIFSVVSGVILRPLVYPRPEQLLRLTSHSPATGTTHGLSYPEYVEFREMNRSFAEVGVFTTGRSNTGGGGGAWTGEVNITTDEGPARVRSAGVDDRLLKALGVQPSQGRLFGPGETDAMPSRPGLGGPPIVILSHEFWQRAFGGQPIVGRAVSLDGRPHDVVGVMPPGIDLLDSRPDVWLPIGVHPATRQIRTSHVLSVVGRLKDGVTLQDARTELNLFLENWSARANAKGHVPTSHPQRAEDHTLQLEPLRDAIVADASRAIWALQVSVGLVLLIGCANLANLAMVRAESRRPEFAIRTALGASRGQLLRQTMTEGVLVSLAGGALGVWLAALGVRALVALYPGSLPRASGLAVDGPVLLFALGVSIATGLLFGLIPLGPGQLRDGTRVLRDGGTRTASRGGRYHVRRALVTAEIALAVMLVTGAGLLVRTVANLARVDPGFDRSGLVTFSMTMPRGVSYPGGRVQVYERLLERIGAVPGVESVTAMAHLPLDRVAQRIATRVEDDTAPNGYTSEIVDYYQFVMSAYFETMRVPIVAGRAFDAADATSFERVVIVSETLANRLWKGRNPIGRRLRPNLSASLGTRENPWHTVIGVARDVKEGGVARETGTELYMFVEQPAPSMDGTDTWTTTAPPTMNVALRTPLPPAALSQTLEAAVHEADPAIPITRLRAMEGVFAESIGRQRLLAQLSGAFAGLALLLAAVGTYGVLSYVAAERRREIGIRMALGAPRSGVIRLVMTQGFQAAVVGLVLGIAGAFAVGRLIGTLLFGVGATDPATLAAVTATITLVATVACWLPAWRASRLDPTAVLRAD